MAGSGLSTTCLLYTSARLYGEITLDWAVGGLNPHAVQAELLLGGRMVFMPTFHAQNSRVRTNFKEHPVGGPGISILGPDGRLLPAVHDILDLVKSFDAVLATGHLSAQESYVLADEGIRRGVTMLLTHPDSLTENIPLEWQRELAARGAYVEKCWLNVLKGAVTEREVCRRALAVGPERCVLTTDLGQAGNPSPVEGMADFALSLSANGCSDAQIRRMLRENPRTLLRIVN